MATIDEIAPEIAAEDRADSEPIIVTLAHHGETFDVLSSQTARDIVSVLAKSATTVSNLATTVDTTIQNVNYHLDRLQSVGLITAVGKKYSERGREMTLYALDGSLCIVVIGQLNAEDLREATDEAHYGCAAPK